MHLTRPGTPLEVHRRTWVIPILYVQSFNWILQAAFMREHSAKLLHPMLCLSSIVTDMPTPPLQ